MFFLEIIKFVIYSGLIVLIVKYILVKSLRALAEYLDFSAKTVGGIAGIATSVPEFLTVTISSVRDFYGASIYNILSSNVINLIQYIVTIIMNKNIRKLKNNAIIADLAMVAITIIIPIILIKHNIKLDLYIVPLFIFFFVLFRFLNRIIHEAYLQKENNKMEVEIEKERKKEKRSKRKITKYGMSLIIGCILLFIIGELLGNTLENLCNLFNVSQVIVGLLLGFFTSVPELITFFESQKHHKKAKTDTLGVIEATNNLFASNVINLFVIQTIGIIIINIV